MGISEDVFWKQTPKTIQIYFEAYKKTRQRQIQDMWTQGAYFRSAIISSIHLGKGNPPPYPKMPFTEESDNSLADDEEWLKLQREKAKLKFMTILNKK